MTEDEEAKLRQFIDELDPLVPRQGAYGALEPMDEMRDGGLRFTGNQAGYLLYGIAFLKGGLRAPARDQQGNLHAATSLPPIASEESLQIDEFLRNDEVSGDGVHYHWQGAWVSRILGLGCLLFGILAIIGLISVIKEVLAAWAA